MATTMERFAGYAAADDFDLIVGTSTTGIIALWLGKIGTEVWRSLASKWPHKVVVRPKRSQDRLQLARMHVQSDLWFGE